MAPAAALACVMLLGGWTLPASVMEGCCRKENLHQHSRGCLQSRDAQAEKTGQGNEPSCAW